MRKLTLSTAAVLVLAACVDPAAERLAAENRALELWNLRQELSHERCVDYGLVPGTDGYIECRKDYDLADLEARQRQRDRNQQVRTAIMQQLWSQQ